MRPGERTASDSEPRGERMPAPGKSERLAFGPFVLDPEAGGLVDGSREVPLPPKPFETLHYLASRPGRVVSKTELLDSLWAETHVTEDVLVQCVVEIRRALGDHARQPRYIQTVPRRGYRFVGDVRVLGPEPTGAAAEERAATAEAGGSGIGTRFLPGLMVGLAAAAVLATLFVWESQARRVEAARAPTRPGALLVAPILVEGPEEGEGWLHHGLAELIRAELGQRPGVHVVAGHRYSAALEASEVRGEQPTPYQSLELARTVGAEKLVSGSFVRVGDRFVLSVQLVHVPTGVADGSAMVEGFYPDDVLDAVDELCVRVLERWDGAEPLRASGAWRPVRMAASSLDAFRQYSEALVWFARGGVRGADEAERRLDRALQLDPRFAYAQLKKAEIQHWRRRHGYPAGDPVPAIRAAAALRDEMPEREQLLVDLMQAALVAADTEAAIRIYEDLTTRYPTFAEQVGVPTILGDVFVQEGRWDRLVELGLRHIDSPSLPGSERALLASFLGRAYRQMGEFDRAMAYAQRAVRLWPTQDGPGFLRRRGERGRIALEAGQREHALADFEAIARDQGADAGSLTEAAWGFYMAGDRGRAARVTERALELDPGYGNAYHLRGWLALARDDYEAAARDLYTAFERTRQVHADAQFGFPSTGSGDLAALYYAGVAEQKRGRADRAAAHYREVIRISDAGGATRHASEGGVPPWEAAYLSALALARLGEPVPELPRLEGDDATFFLQSARLLAVMSENQAALDHLRKALRLTPGERQHVIDDPNFESLRDDAAFLELVGKEARRVVSR